MTLGEQTIHLHIEKLLKLKIDYSLFFDNVNNFRDFSYKNIYGFFDKYVPFSGD